MLLLIYIKDRGFVMAKKFFYNRVYNTKRTIVNFVIIGVCVIGIVLCFILTSNFQAENQNEPQGSLSIKKEVTVEVNEDFNNEVYFSKIENVDVNKLDIKYPDDYSITKTGVYNVIITIVICSCHCNIIVIVVYHYERVFFFFFIFNICF